MIMYTACLYELIKLFLLKKWLLMEHISKRRIAQEYVFHPTFQEQAWYPSF